MDNKIEMPKFGHNEDPNSAFLKSMPKFDPDNQKSITLHKFWTQLCAYINQCKLTEKATKYLLSNLLQNGAYDIYQDNAESTVEEIMNLLAESYDYPNRDFYESQETNFEREPGENLRPCLKRYESILRKLIEKEENQIYLIKRDCNRMLKKVCHPETKIHLERAEQEAKTQGKELSYDERLTILDEEEKIIRKNQPDPPAHPQFPSYGIFMAISQEHEKDINTEIDVQTMKYKRQREFAIGLREFVQNHNLIRQNTFISKEIIDTAIYLGHLFYEKYSPDEFNHDMMKYPILITAIETKYNKPRLIQEILTFYHPDEKEDVMNNTSMVYELCKKEGFIPPSHYIRQWYPKDCKHRLFTTETQEADIFKKAIEISDLWMVNPKVLLNYPTTTIARLAIDKATGTNTEHHTIIQSHPFQENVTLKTFEDKIRLSDETENQEKLNYLSPDNNYAGEASALDNEYQTEEDDLEEEVYNEELEEDDSEDDLEEEPDNGELEADDSEDDLEYEAEEVEGEEFQDCHEEQVY